MSKTKASRFSKRVKKHIDKARGTVKHPATAEMCSQLMKEKKLTARAMAEELGIHHSTFQGYLDGRHRPAPHIRVRMVGLAGAASWDELMDRCMQKRHGKLHERVCERRQQEKAAVQKRARGKAKTQAEVDAYAQLSEEEIRHLVSKLRRQKAKLERQRHQAAKQLELWACYHEDDRMAADLAKERLDQAQRALSFLESHASPVETIDLQRKEVERLQREYNRLYLCVDTISNTAPVFVRLALAELDAAIRLREEMLEELAGLSF